MLKYLAPLGKYVVITRVETFNTEYNYDFVTFYDGPTTRNTKLARFNGDYISIGQVYSTGNTLLVKFTRLIFLFVKRDFVSQYKQTVLGPVWFFVQPILTAVTFTVIFGNLAKISGSDIYALQSDGNLTMVGTQFDVMQGGGPNSIHMEGVKYMGTAIKIKSKTRPIYIILGDKK
jgi:hypothetical protein